MKQYALVAVVIAAVVFAFAIPVAQAVEQVFDNLGTTLSDVALIKLHRAN